MGETLLVTSVGTGDYDETTYVLEGTGEYTTNLFPLALANLLGVDSALVVRTPEAGEMYDDQLGNGFADLGVTYGTETIPKIEEQNDADAVLQTIFDAIGDGRFDPDSVVLDVTHAYRSLPMVFFASLMQLDALGVAAFEGIYYGEYQKDRERSYVIDLTYLHTLMEWYYSFQSFDKTGSLRAVYQLLQQKRTRLFKSGEEPVEFASLVDLLRRAQRYLDSGLPLEAGIAVKDAIDKLDALDPDRFVGPEGAVLEPLRQRLVDFQIQQTASDKTDVRLDLEEIRRQRDIVEFYRETGRYWLALECARELFISRLLYERGTRDGWLDHDARTEAKPEPHSGNGGSDDGVPEARKLWERLRDARNMYAHAGHKLSGIQNEDKIDRNLRQLCERIDDDEFWQVDEL